MAPDMAPIRDTVPVISLSQDEPSSSHTQRWLSIARTNTFKEFCASLSSSEIRIGGAGAGVALILMVVMVVINVTCCYIIRK